MYTGVVGSLDEHPIRRLRDAGVLVTVNTDDPKMFNNSLAKEYALLQARLGFSADEVRGCCSTRWPPPGCRSRASSGRPTRSASDPAWTASPST